MEPADDISSRSIADTDNKDTIVESSGTEDVNKCVENVKDICSNDVLTDTASNMHTSKGELSSRPDAEDSADIKQTPTVENNVKNEPVDSEASEFISQKCCKTDIKAEDKQTLNDGDVTDKNIGSEGADSVYCQGNKSEKMDDNSYLKITGMTVNLFVYNTNFSLSFTNLIGETCARDHKVFSGL